MRKTSRWQVRQVGLMATATPQESQPPAWHQHPGYDMDTGFLNLEAQGLLVDYSSASHRTMREALRYLTQSCRRICSGSSP